MTTDIEQIVEPARSIEAMWQEILDKDDRNSPSEYPEMVMLTFDEFKAYVEEGRESLLSALKEAQERAERGQRDLALQHEAMTAMATNLTAISAERDALAAERDSANADLRKAHEIDCRRVVMLTDLREKFSALKSELTAEMLMLWREYAMSDGGTLTPAAQKLGAELLEAFDARAGADLRARLTNAQARITELEAEVADLHVTSESLCPACESDFRKAALGEPEP